MLKVVYAKIRERVQVPPSLLVLVVVLVLLYGFVGAVHVLWGMVIQMLAALLGGGDEDALASVVWRTLPLALAAAGVAYAISSRWLQLDSLQSYVVVAMIILGGAVVGNAFHESFQSKGQLAVVEPLSPGASPQPIGLPVSTTIASQAVGVAPQSPGAAELPKPKSVWQQLAGIRWFAAPDLTRKPQPVQPLNLLPAGPGVVGAVSRATNQLLGYLVSYEPRLFLASVVAGGFFGWRVQRRVAVAKAMVTGDTSELSEQEIGQIAA